MDTRTAYCSACDQQVRIAVTPASTFSGQAPVSDQPDVVCLDFGERCTGAMCPMIGLPRILMGMRLAQSGLRPDKFERIEGVCSGCGNVTELEVLDLRDCPWVDDVVLDALSELDALRSVLLRGTHVSQQGVARLRQALPGCLVAVGVPAEAGW